MEGKINWFPGHMVKAFRIIEEQLKNVDAVLYVLDARAPAACVNPEFDRVLKDKPRLYILNKADLTEKSYAERWLSHFKRKGFSCIALNSASGPTACVLTELKRLLSAKLERYEEKGIKKTLRAMVIGIPNSGKSTLINGLVGKRKTLTGDKPGITKTKQWVSVGCGMEILDTPGALWPSLTDQEAAKDLFFIGSIKPEIFDNTGLAVELISKLRRIAPDKLRARYVLEGFEDTSDTEVLKKIAESRGCVSKGGETDTDRAAVILLEDFKKTRIGKIGLEEPV